MYKPKSKRSVTTGSPQKKKELNGLTANKNIDDIRALASLSNDQSSLIKKVQTEISTKQDKITLTTTGSSGASTFIGNILNIPQYLGVGSVAGGDLSGSYPNPSVIKLLGNTIPINANGYLKNDGSGGLTWATVSTGITVNTTPITGGVDGRVLFQGTGAVVSESASIFWDIAGNKLNLGSLGVQGELVINRSSTGGSVGGIKAESTGNGIHIGGSGYLDSIIMTNGGGTRFNTWSGSGSVSIERMRIFATTGNIGVNTATDAGYKADINGSLRVNSSFSITSPSFAGGFSFTMNAANTLVASSSNIGTWLQVGGGNRVFIVGQEFNSTSRGNIFGNTVGGEAVGISNIIAQSSGTTALIGLNIRYAINNTGTYSGIVRGLYYNPTLTSLTGTTHRAIETVTGDVLLATTSGSLLVGTSTLAGYKVDINGTVRVQGVITGSVGGGGLTLGAASANQVGIALSGYFVSNGAIATNNANPRSFNTVIGGQGSGIVATYNSIAQGQTTTNEYFVVRGNINLTDGAIDLLGFSFSPTIVSEVGATIKAFSSGLIAASNHYNLYLSGTAQNYIAGQLAIGVITANASAHVQIDSTTRGFLPPRMTTTQINAIVTPAEGLQVYNTTISHMCVYQAGIWVKINHSPM